MKLQTKEDMIAWLETKSEELANEMGEIQEVIDNMTESELIQADCDTSPLWEEHDRIEAKRSILLELLEKIERDTEPLDAYQERLKRWFGNDLNIRTEVEEIHSNYGQKVFLVYHNERLNLMRLFLSIDGISVEISQDAVMPCSDPATYLTSGALLKELVKSIS